MRFSVIIPSFLGAYENAASNRDTKIIRAIESVLNQTFEDFEIWVVADGCEKTFNIIEDKYINDERINCLLIRKQPIWSGAPRNYGINKASGDYIVYLDIDDVFGPNHLAIIDSELTRLNNPTWVWFNDMLKKKKVEGFYERQILINQRFQCGTSNICHRQDALVRWGGSGYGLDDWGAIQQLQRYGNHAKIKTPEYIVCHLQQGLDA